METIRLPSLSLATPGFALRADVAGEVDKPFWR